MIEEDKITSLRLRKETLGEFNIVKDIEMFKTGDDLIAFLLAFYAKYSQDNDGIILNPIEDRKVYKVKYADISIKMVEKDNFCKCGKPLSGVDIDKDSKFCEDCV